MTSVHVPRKRRLCRRPRHRAALVRTKIDDAGDGRRCHRADGGSAWLHSRIECRRLRPPCGRYSDLSVLKAVFPIDGLSIEIWKQPALCLGQMQVDGSGLATGGQKLPDIVHVRAWLVFRFKLLQRDQRRCQCFRDNPFVVAGNSLFWHLAPPRILLSRQNARDRPCAPRAGSGRNSPGAFLVHSSRSSIEGVRAIVAESEIAKKAGIIDRKRIPEPRARIPEPSTLAYSMAVAGRTFIPVIVTRFTNAVPMPG